MPLEGAEWEIEFKTSKSFTQNWCNSLVDNLQKSFSTIHSSIIELTNNVKSFNDNLSKKIDDVSKVANSNTTAIAELRSEVKDLRADLTEVAKICSGLTRENVAIKEQNTALKEQHVSMESYSRRNNLIVYGIAEVQGETNIDCARSVRSFLKNALQLTDGAINSIGFERCHRLRNEVRGTRPVIVRFTSYRDRELIWSKTSSLKGMFPLSMSEDFPSEVTFRRKKLYPIYNTQSQQTGRTERGQIDYRRQAIHS